MKVTFREEDHTYWSEGGLEVPSVTGILKAVGLSKDFTSVDNFYRERGIAVHEAIQLYADNNLDEKSLDPVIVPYLEGAKRFLDTMKEKPKAEVVYGNEPYWFAGTVDAEFPELIVDWKCSKSHDKVAELQGEGYKLLAPGKVFKVVQLPGDGSYEEFDYGDRVEYWTSVMKTYQWWRKTHPRSKADREPKP